ncbi:hypothetical protein BHM03_00026526 [Ensete ventricosum]|nr:hypothetical protein BHM03_00026526 [Ensete ventricosum]
MGAVGERKDLRRLTCQEKQDRRRKRQREGGVGQTRRGAAAHLGRRELSRWLGKGQRRRRRKRERCVRRKKEGGGGRSTAYEGRGLSGRLSWRLPRRRRRKRERNSGREEEEGKGKVQTHRRLPLHAKKSIRIREEPKKGKWESHLNTTRGAEETIALAFTTAVSWGLHNPKHPFLVVRRADGRPSHLASNPAHADSGRVDLRSSVEPNSQVYSEP